MNEKEINETDDIVIEVDEFDPIFVFTERCFALPILPHSHCSITRSAYHKIVFDLDGGDWFRVPRHRTQTFTVLHIPNFQIASIKLMKPKKLQTTNRESFDLPSH